MQEFAVGLIGDPVLAGLPMAEVPLGPLRIRHAAPSAPGAWTSPSGVRSAERWQDVVADEALHAIVVTLTGEAASEPLLGGLAAGRTMFCSAPPALEPAMLLKFATARRGRALFLCPNSVALTEAGRAARDCVRADEFGRLQSAYVAVRAPLVHESGTGEARLSSLGWDALEYVLSCLPSAIARVHAIGGRLFDESSRDDTLVAIIEADDGAVITAEISCCLAASDRTELEFDFVGSEQALRLEPLKSFHVRCRTSRHARPLLDPPSAALIAVLAEALRSGDRIADDLERQIAVAEVFEAIETSLRSRASVELGPERLSSRKTVERS